MPRLYTVSFSEVLIAAPQDLFQINGPMGSRIARIRRAIISSTDTSAPTAQMLGFQARFLPATVTNGSGGTAPTPARVDQGDQAPTITSFVNNTTPASTSGSAVILYQGGCHIYNGLDEDFDDRRLGSPVFGAGEAWVFQLLSTVTGTAHLSGTVWIEEMGG